MTIVGSVSDFDRCYNGTAEKSSVELKLMCELNEGRRSGEEEGYITADEVRAYFRGKETGVDL